MLRQPVLLRVLQAGFEVAQIDACLLCRSDDFGDACTVLHLMIAPEQGAAGAGAAVGEDGLGNAFEQVLEGGDISGVDGGCDDGLMMVGFLLRRRDGCR